MSNILFVLEGKKTEPQIISSIKKHFLNQKNEIVECVYGADVYQLYQQILEDEFLDIFELLKERDKETLSKYKRIDFAQIYLFFDYDGHATIAEDKKIEKLLETFDNETENGKLFISYPMVEALKHIPKNKNDFQNLKVEAKKNINYKKIVHDKGENTYRDFTNLPPKHWKELIVLHLKKMNFIVNGHFTLPCNTISQIDIFQKQCCKYLSNDEVAVLSAFPVFLFDYFGSKKLNSLLQ